MEKDKNLNEYDDSNSDSGGNLDALKNLSLKEIAPYLKNMKNDLKVKEESEVGILQNIIVAVNDICVGLSELNITDAASYLDCRIQDTKDVNSKVQTIIKKLTTPPASGGMTEERKEYMEKYKSFFDEIYDAYKVPEDKRNYTTPSLDFTRAEGNEPLTDEQKEFITNDIKKSTMFKKNDFLKAIKNSSLKSSSLDPNTKVTIDELNSYKNEIRSYLFNLQKYVSMEGSVVEFLIENNSGEKEYKKVSKINIQGDTVTYILEDGTQQKQIIYASLRNFLEIRDSV